MSLRGRRLLGEYGWLEVREDLERGIHPEVVAARLGESVSNVLEIADQQGWAITWQPGKARWPLTELDA